MERQKNYNSQNSEEANFGEYTVPISRVTLNLFYSNQDGMGLLKVRHIEKWSRIKSQEIDQQKCIQLIFDK